MNKVLITGETEDEIWRKISDDLGQNEPLDYQVYIESQGRQISLNIDIDLGGGFEGGYAVTSFSSLLHKNDDFRFAIHREDFIDEIGKFFGMQDVLIGYPEFDNKMIIKTNDEARVKFIFSDPGSRQVFQSLENFSFGVAHHHVADSEFKEPFLELIIEDGITEVAALRQIYNAFTEVLTKMDPLG
ncbi:hypothetical protein [Desertivirga xinjiangensis]|uniref:hypothetical protein n=1 Tax=Desertivirga xinjiangensis TaxID=539206 RepID=UPI0021097EEB|nr:hypothetical protein [Pedobacter xinjiangensis]